MSALNRDDFVHKSDRGTRQRRTRRLAPCVYGGAARRGKQNGWGGFLNCPHPQNPKETIKSELRGFLAHNAMEPRGYEWQREADRLPCLIGVPAIPRRQYARTNRIQSCCACTSRSGTASRERKSRHQNSDAEVPS